MEINSVSDAILPSILGLAIVFIALIAIMGVIYLIAMFFKDKEVKLEPATSITNQHSNTLELINTTDRDAALIMAIVANKMQVQPEKLRFKYIKRL